MRAHLPNTVTGLALRRPISDATESGPDLSAIYGERAEFVWLTLQRLGVRDADLEDLAHDVFLIAHRKLRFYDGTSRVTTWLFGICLRVAANYRRRAHVRLERPMGGVETYEGISDGREPEELLGLREARVRLTAVLNSLDLTKRAVFVMFEVEGLSCGEIAAQVGIPVGTVYSRLHAARRAFADAVSAGNEKGKRGKHMKGGPK
jgi:RNA polymerase sigma-70 factor, ECF subfamily